MVFVMEVLTYNKILSKYITFLLIEINKYLTTISSSDQTPDQNLPTRLNEI